MKENPIPDPAPSTGVGKKRKPKKSSKPKFKGETDGMNEFVFQTSDTFEISYQSKEDQLEIPIYTISSRFITKCFANIIEAFLGK